MDKLFLNLQWFAEAGTLVNTTVGYRNAYDGTLTEFDGTYDLSTLNKTYFDTTLLDNARDQLIFAQLGKKQPLPANHGRTIEFRRWKTLGKVSQLTEGVIPTGKKMSIAAITASLTQYGRSCHFQLKQSLRIGECSASRMRFFQREDGSFVPSSCRIVVRAASATSRHVPFTFKNLIVAMPVLYHVCSYL